MATPDFFPNIVIDLGSSTIKVGYNEESCPRLVIPNVWGTSKKNLINIIGEEDKVYYGNEALLNCPNLDLTYYQGEHNGKYPTEGKDNDYFEGMFKYIFEQLKAKPTEYKIFIIDSLFTTDKERDALAKILFEKYCVSQIHIEPQSVIALYSTAKQSGIIVDSGEIYTSIVPIYEGYVIPNAVITSPIAGRELTKQFMKYHKADLDSNNVCAQYEMSRQIKEKAIEILLDPNDEGKRGKEKINFLLPDGNIIEIGDERFNIGELMFDPSYLGGGDMKGVHELIMESIEKLDMNIRSELLNNIIIGGGNSLIKGFEERLKKELEVLVSKSIYAKNTVKIHSHDEMKYMAWAGASGICSIGKFRDKWISKNEYDENGPSCLEQNYIFA